MRVGRNEPCPCGSAKKFKKCCGRSTDRDVMRPVEEPPFDPVESFWFVRGELAREKCPRFLGDLLAAADIVSDWLTESSEEKAFDGFLETEGRYVAILGNIVEDDADIDGFIKVRTPFDLDTGSFGLPPGALFLERFRETLPGDAVRAVEALLAAEDAFVAVERQGRQTFLRRLTDGRVLPVERTAGRAGHLLLGRLVEIADHFCLLTPEKVSRFSQEECLRLQEILEKTAPELAKAGIASLRKPAFALQLVRLMLEHGPPEEESSAGFQEQARIEKGRRQPPVILNADGHAAILMTSSFEVLDLGRLTRELARPLWNADLQTGETPDGGIRTLAAVLSRRPKKSGFPGGEIILATLRAERGVLRVETNSVERDREVRRHLNKLPSGILRFRETTSRPIKQELEKPLSEKTRRRLEKEHEDLMRNPEVRRRLDEITRDSSLRWCDEVIPALGNRKPRILVKTKAGRAKVLSLIEQLEPTPMPAGGAGTNFALIRRELGLPPAR